MSALMGLSLSVLVSLVLSTALVVVLSRPLEAILAQLCPSADASRFWVAFTSVMLYIAPLLFAMFSSFDTVNDVTAVIRLTLVTTLVGASAALMVVGWNIANARPRVSVVQ